MSRVPLAQAAELCGVRPGTIRRWVHDGRVTRHWDGYDFDELAAVKNGRSLDALASRQGIPLADRTWPHDRRVTGQPVISV